MLEGNIYYNFPNHFHFQMIKQKVCLLLENFDQLKNLNIDFVPDFLF